MPTMLQPSHVPDSRRSLTASQIILFTSICVALASYIYNGYRNFEIIIGNTLSIGKSEKIELSDGDVAYKGIDINKEEILKKFKASISRYISVGGEEEYFSSLQHQSLPKNSKINPKASQDAYDDLKNRAIRVYNDKKEYIEYYNKALDDRNKAEEIARHNFNAHRKEKERAELAEKRAEIAESAINLANFLSSFGGFLGGICAVATLCMQILNRKKNNTL